MNATRALVALMACLAIGTSHAQQREYIVYDGQSYPGDQLDVAAASPVMVKPAQSEHQERMLGHREGQGP